MSEQKIGCAIFGAGWVADEHINAYIANPNAEMVAIGSRREASARAAAEKAGLVLNWKDKRDFALDLRTAPTSPARGAGPDDTDIGAKLDIQAFARGDTAGDGKPDIRRAGK